MKKALFENIGGNRFKLANEAEDIPGLDDSKHYTIGKIIGFADKPSNTTRDFTNVSSIIQAGYANAMKTADPEFEAKWARIIGNIRLHSQHLRDTGNQSGLHSKI